MQYHVVQLLFAEQTLFVLWFDGETSGVLTDQNRLLFAQTVNPLINYADSNSLVLNTNSVTHFGNVDFNEALFWLDHPSPDVNCEYFLGVWNTLSDVLNSCDNSGHFLQQHENENGIHLYNKLFWGANLPGYTPTGKIDIPDWRFEDLCFLQSTLQTGCNELLNVIHQGRELV